MKERLFSPGVITLIFVSFVFGIGEFIVIGIANEIAAGVGTGIDSIMFLISIFAVAYAVASPLLTFITSKLNKYIAFIVFIAIFLMATLLSFAANDYAVLAVSRIITAAVSGAGLASALSFVSDVTENKRHIPKVIALVFTGFSIACTIGLPMGVLIEKSFGWRAAFAVTALLAVIAIILAIVTLPRKQEQQAWDTEHHHDTDAPERKGSVLKDPRILLTMAFSILGMGAFYIFFAPVESIMKDCLGLSAEQASVGLLIFGFAALIGNLCSSRFAEKGGYRSLRIVMVIQTMIFAVMGLALNNLFSGMLMIVCMGLVVYLMNAPNQVHYMEIASRWYPSSMRLASSFNPMSFNIGIALGSFLSGILIGPFGLENLGYFAALLSLAALAVCIAIVSIEKDPERMTSLCDNGRK